MNENVWFPWPFTSATRGGKNPAWCGERECWRWLNVLPRILLLDYYYFFFLNAGFCPISIHMWTLSSSLVISGVFPSLKKIFSPHHTPPPPSMYYLWSYALVWVWKTPLWWGGGGTSWMNFCSSSVKLPMQKKEAFFGIWLFLWSDLQPSHVPGQESCSLLNSFLLQLQMGDCNGEQGQV